MSNLDPRIGQLSSGKYYAYPKGYKYEPVIGTLEEIEIALGLRRTFRTYAVTVRPGVESWNVKTYTVEVTARTRNDAIKIARREYAENVGVRNNGAASFTARLSTNPIR